MATSILVTKLFVPPTRAKLVHRPGLIERLNYGLDRKLTLLSAPAGFGKTTLVSHWVEHLRDKNEIGDQPIRIAWLSLDGDDNDPVRFLTYFIAALNQIKDIETELGQGALSMLQSPQPPPANNILISLINELAIIPEKIIFVLDDYHLIEAKPIDQALVFLLENLPPQLHLVIATRQDPHLSLGRLRARAQVTELRATDLRFSFSEAADFLNQVMGLNLSSQDIAELETRTEGWIAGLQLAAISMRGHEDHTDFIRSFTGSHHLVLDYLIEEVLEQQPENIHNFLLQTSILNRFTGKLCDAITEQDNSLTILEMLERANLFVIPLDDERCWYRYHHLFADLLRQRLRKNRPEQLSALHHVASEWYEKNGFDDEAIEHALHAEDFERTAKLIESVADAVWARGEGTKLQHWLEKLPEELVLSKPHLCIFRAWEFFACGQQDAAERFLQAAELAYNPSTDQATDPESHKRNQLIGSTGMRVRGRAAAIRAWMAAYRTDVPGIIQHSQEALEYLPNEDLNWRSAAAITLGDAYFLEGDYYAAYQARVNTMHASEAAGNIYLFMNASAKLALTLKAQGQLLQVQDLCQQRVRFAKENGLSQTAVVGWLLAIWGEVLAETNDLDEALNLVQKGIELTKRGEDVVMLGWSYLCLTKVLFSKGDLAGAERIVQKLDNISRESIVPIWIMNLNAAWLSRIWLVQDNLEAASQWVKERGLETDKELTYVSGLEYIALARIMIAQERWDETTSLLQRMLETAEVGGRYY